jgi:hypothetical protein
VFGVPLFWFLQFLGNGGFPTFIHGGLGWLREASTMKWLWWIGFFISFGFFVYWLIQSKIKRFPFVWMPWLVLFSLSLMFYLRDIPSIKHKGFLPSHDNASYRLIIHDRQHSAVEMVHAGQECYSRGDYAYTVICLEIAKNKCHSPLNQYWPFYIGALLETGREDDADNEKNEMLFEVEGVGNHTNDSFNVVGIMSQVMVNLDEAMINLPKDDKAYLGKIAKECQPYYDQLCPQKQPLNPGSSGLPGLSSPSK